MRVRAKPEKEQERKESRKESTEGGQRKWPPFVTTTMELDETKGACQLYSWQIAHVRFISDHGSTRNDDGLNGVRGGECWPHPNDMHTDEHRPQRQTLDRISRTCTRRVARREACSVRRTLCRQRDAGEHLGGRRSSLP